MDISLISPCGADCFQCEQYPASCRGCHAIKGKAWWVRYKRKSVCDFYNCCIAKKKLVHCGQCPSLPCKFFFRGDPTKSDEENQRIREKQLAVLKSLT